MKRLLFQVEYMRSNPAHASKKKKNNQLKWRKVTLQRILTF